MGTVNKNSPLVKVMVIEISLNYINEHITRIPWELLIQIQVQIQIQNYHFYINGLAQNCSNSIANALELLQFCTKSLL